MNYGGGISFIPIVPPAGSPGPPFVPTSADNGLSVDPVTGRIVFGNDIGDNTADFLSDRSIDMKDFLFQFLNNGNLQQLIDPVNLLYQFGDIDQANNGVALSINDNSQVATIRDTLGRMLLLNRLNAAYNIGDIDAANNGSFLEVDDNNSLITAIGNAGFKVNDTTGNTWGNIEPNVQFRFGDINQTGNNATLTGAVGSSLGLTFSDILGSYFVVDPTSLSNNYVLGDLNDVFNGSRIVIDDANEIFRLQTTAETALFLAPQVYSLGNVNDTLQGSKISIDDANRSLVFSTLTDLRTMALEGSLGTQQIGDVDGAFSGLKMRIDQTQEQFSVLNTAGLALFIDAAANIYSLGDINQSVNGNSFAIDDTVNLFSFTNQALNSSISMNGVTGFTGTVGPVITSITVNGGIVTNVT